MTANDDQQISERRPSAHRTTSYPGRPREDHPARPTPNILQYWIGLTIQLNDFPSVRGYDLWYKQSF